MRKISQAYEDLGPTFGNYNRIPGLRRSSKIRKKSQDRVQKVIDYRAPRVDHIFKQGKIQKLLSELGIQYRWFQQSYPELPKRIYPNTSHTTLDRIIGLLECEIHLRINKNSHLPSDQD